MRRFIILALLLCLTSMSSSQEIEKIEKFSDCIKTEAYTHLTGMVIDIYYGKINFSEFISKYLEWSIRSDASISTKCLSMLELNKSQLFLKSVFSKIGMTILYASNCEKDIGPALIVLDNVLSNLENVKSEWKQALMNTFTLGLIGYQSYKDCRSAFESIRDIWTNSHK